MGILYSLLRVNEHTFPPAREDQTYASAGKALGGGVAHPGTATDDKRDRPIIFTLHDLLQSE
jgi:hypothetical protein